MSEELRNKIKKTESFIKLNISKSMQILLMTAMQRYLYLTEIMVKVSYIKSEIERENVIKKNFVREIMRPDASPSPRALFRELKYKFKCSLSKF